MSTRGGGRSEPGDAVRLKLLRSIFEHANDAVLVTGGGPIDEPGPRIVYANPAFARMTGYAPEGVVGRSPRVLHGPGTQRERLDEIRAALQAGRPVRVELLNDRKDGTPFWAELDIVPVFGEEGRAPEGWVSMRRETTERVQAERSLRSVLARYCSDMITSSSPTVPRATRAPRSRAL